MKAKEKRGHVEAPYLFDVPKLFFRLNYATFQGSHEYRLRNTMQLTWSVSEYFLCTFMYI